MGIAALTVAAALAAVPLQPTAAGAAGEGRQVLCDRADYGCVADTGYHGQSVWGANYGKVGHNCTSYVSYLLAQQGVAQPWHPMGNAGQWDDRGAGRIPVDDVPAAGAVAVWEGHGRYTHSSAGHVAYVDDLDATAIIITEDNTGGGTRRARIERGSPYWPDHFVHIHDVDPLGLFRKGLDQVSMDLYVGLARVLRLPF